MSAQSFGALPSPAQYQTCLSSLREDANTMIPELEDGSRVVYQKKSLYDRELFLIDSKKIYSCGELSQTSQSSTSDVLHYRMLLRTGEKAYSLSVEIPTVLTYGIEDFIMRSSDQEEERALLKCSETTSSHIDAAFLETVGSRLMSYPLQLRENAQSKKNQEKAKIWGADWKAKGAIDSERSSYLRVLTKCENLSVLKPLVLKIKKELLSIK